MRPRRTSLFGSLAIVAASVLLATGMLTSSSFGGPPAPGGRPPAWTPPLTLGAGAEPSITTLPKGSKDQQAAIVSAPTGTGSNFWYIDVVKHPNGTYTMKGSAPQQPDLGTGGGDSDISVGQLSPTNPCPAIAYTGLHNIDALDNFTAARSDTCGESFTNPPNLYATQNTATDRQWQTFDGRLTNHLIYHKVDTGQIVDSISYDGGFTYVTQAGPAGIGAIGSLIDAQHAYTLPELKIGNIVTDYAHPVKGKFYPAAPVGSGEQIHPLYAIFAGTASAQEAALAQNPNAGYDYLDTLYLAKSLDGGLTWTDSTVFSVPAASHRELDLVFPVIGIDAVGNLYALWSDGFKVQYAFSTDHGAKWSKAFQINPDNRGTKPDPGRADLFPWLVGGGAGKIDVVWYHGAGGDTSAYRNPGTNDTTHGVTRWKVAYAQLFNATRQNSKNVPNPTITSLSQAVTPAIHKGSVCNNGTTCGITSPGDRTLLDFFQVAIDSAGRANIAYASDFSSPGNASTVYTRQNSGLSAITGKPVAALPFVTPTVRTGTSCPGPQVIDPKGDAAGTITNDPAESNIASDDILSVRFATPDATSLKITMKLNNLSSTPAPGTASTQWNAYWKYKAKTYYASATSNGPGVQTFDVGTDDAGTMTSNGTVPGTFTEGPGGTITWTVPRNLIGSPPDHVALKAPYADDHGSFTVNGSGLHYVAAVDRAPDAGTGARYVVGGAC